MKLIMYFGLIILSLFTSLFYAVSQMKKSKRFWRPFLTGFFQNVIILSMGSFWWYSTETDGISQGLGVMYYCFAMGIIGVINFVTLSILKKKYQISY